MSRALLRRLDRVEETLTPPARGKVFVVIDRGPSPEDRAEGEARVEELYASGQISRDAKGINLIHVQIVAPAREQEIWLAR